jgi:hypothetical protein
MIRIDYKINADAGVVNLTVVEIENDKHSLCGRLVLSKQAYDNLRLVIEFYDEFGTPISGIVFEEKN